MTTLPLHLATETPLPDQALARQSSFLLLPAPAIHQAVSLAPFPAEDQQAPLGSIIPFGTSPVSDGIHECHEIACVREMAEVYYEHTDLNGTSIDQSDVQPPLKRRPRGASMGRSHIWTRHHAICVLGVICDVQLGGYDAARLAVNPLNSGIKLTKLSTILLEVCPWLLNDLYLNLKYSIGLNESGLDRCFKDWAHNRAYHFYRYPEASEHPVNRIRANLRLVYREFYDAFSGDVSERLAIPEVQAREFWVSVGERVPFEEPLNY